MAGMNRGQRGLFWIRSEKRRKKAAMTISPSSFNCQNLLAWRLRAGVGGGKCLGRATQTSPSRHMLMVDRKTKISVAGGEKTGRASVRVELDFHRDP